MWVTTRTMAVELVVPEAGTLIHIFLCIPQHNNHNNNNDNGDESIQDYNDSHERIGHIGAPLVGYVFKRAQKKGTKMNYLVFTLTTLATLCTGFPTFDFPKIGNPVTCKVR